MTVEELVVWNAIGWVAMTIGIVLVRWSAPWSAKSRWVLTALGGIVLMNVLLHAAGSALTRSYSPGLISSLVLWLPLGGFTLVREWRHAARSTFLKGLIAVIVFHALLLLAAVIIKQVQSWQ